LTEHTADPYSSVVTEKQRFGRREVLIGVGAAAVGTAVGARVVIDHMSPQAGEGAAADAAGSAARVETSNFTPPPNMLPAGEDVLALFGGLREGSTLGEHCRIVAIHGLRAGAIPVVLATMDDGERYAVEVFRDAEDGPAPIARAQGLALYLVNRGNGSTQTEEELGLGVMALGRALEARRSAGAPIPEGLTTQRGRLASYPSGAYDVPLA
jgi:hypothetical protein